MEVILLEDVKALGKKGEIVKISDGYARNYVLPKKLGLEANAKNLNDLKLQKAKKQKQDELELAAAKEFATKVESKTVRLSIKTGKEGRVFGAISSKEISLAAKKQFGLDIDKKKMKLEESIKALGTYEIPCKLHKDVTAKLKVVIEEEK